MSDTLVTVARYYDLLKAQLLRNRLEAEGMGFELALHGAVEPSGVQQLLPGQPGCGEIPGVARALRHLVKPSIPLFATISHALSNCFPLMNAAPLYCVARMGFRTTRPRASSTFRWAL